MKKLRVARLLSHGPVAESGAWARVQSHIDDAIEAIHWPPGSGTFSINPVRKGNGVKEIKDAFVLKLEEHGWVGEQPTVAGVGDVDAAIVTPDGTFAVEWETGNISSSHRSLNRLLKGLREGSLVGGILVLPSRALYAYLTDRIGNFQEIEPYFAQYSDYPIANGVLAVVEVEHDQLDPNVPLIRKGTDGRALV